MTYELQLIETWQEQIATYENAIANSIRRGESAGIAEARAEIERFQKFIELMKADLSA